MKTESKVPRAPGVYQITDALDRVVYVGSTGNLRNRLYGHVHDLRHGRHHCDLLIPLWQKDPLSFTFKFKELSSREEAILFEQKYLDELYGNGILLNKADTATGFRAGYQRSEEDIQRQIARQTGKKRDDETIEKIRVSHQNKDRPWLCYKHSDEHRRNQSIGSKGHKKQPGFSEKMSQLRSRPVVIDGQVFPSAKTAAQALSISASEMNRRLNGDRFPSWQYKD